ncbi:MAG: hypothetical protein J7M38_07025 [Armatimonadetes bacterium]|nr:hypothetical protein [Armatimonadota bacterium]
MMPEESCDKRVCPVCGQGLPGESSTRRCPHCGARTLWSRRTSAAPLPLVLFNARLCGIMAGIQVGLISLLCGGYHVPVPPLPFAVSALMPIGAYVLAGAIAQRIAPEVRGGYLALVLALNAGLLAALASAELGLVEPVSLLAITALGTAAAWPLVARALESWLQTNSPQ